ncbi:MAG TPA: DUF3048 domain-containing protein [Anaerolineaceae bacterium]|nr:DUF3048 domain-containing protein [Anaerolineaceae bacterium]
MTKGVSFRLLTSLLAVCIGLVACQPAASPAPNQQTQIAISAGETITAMPTNTPFPPATDTPVPSPTATSTATVIPTTTPFAFGPGNYPANVDPLTGLVVSDPKLLDRSPLMIKVSNFPATGRPHAGLSAADIVFDYFMGVGENRFLALYYGQNSDKVGPIRSGRYVDAQLVPMYQGLLGFAYADIKVYNKIIGTLGNRAFVPGGINCAAICDDGHNTVISVFANTAKFTELAASRAIGNQRPHLEGMSFNSVPPQGGKSANDVMVLFSSFTREEWRYDPSTATYLRWTDPGDTNANSPMIALTDRNTDKQLAFSNVIMIFAMYVEYAPTLHDIMITNNQAGQKAIFFRDGQAYEGIWKSVGANKPMQFFTSNGKPFELKPGNSWIHVMGTNSTVKQDTSNWQVQFFLP